MATAVVDQPLPFSLSSCPKFSKYEKMYESTVKYVGSEIDSIKEWVVMEKIHGANLSLTVWSKQDGKVGVKIGRRNDYLKEGEKFYGLDTQPQLQRQLYESSEKLWKEIQSDNESAIIYGELFGGYYPHSSVPLVPGAVSVQKEVAYCPDLKFCAYDIALCNHDNKVYMDYDKAMDLFSAAGFMYCKPLHCGTLAETINYPIGFVSTLPAIFELPPVDNNLAEGVVVKPLKNSTVMTVKGPIRVIFKLKIPKFSERRALPRPEEHTRLIAEEKQHRYTICTEGEQLKYEIYALVTEQRLVNTLSKTGLPQNKAEWNQLKEELVKDVMESLKDENEELWEVCKDDSVTMATLMNEAKKQCGILISQHKKSMTKND